MVAVNVTVYVEPLKAGVIVNVEPENVAPYGFDVIAYEAMAPPVKYIAIFTVVAAFVRPVRAGTVPLATGAWLSSVTVDVLVVILP